MYQQMEINGLFAQINTPPALSGDALCSLPPHDPCPSYAVDEYPACPKNWMHGSSKASSYFVPVPVGRGMWFDFTRNTHQHDVAIVISVQGINPVTGKKVTVLNLEQYHDKCPVHGVEFAQDRYCPKCEYAWPAQNYIATTTGQTLWIDGFRNEKGEVRQYIITEDVARGIAAQIIGNDRVWAIGFAFYLSKEPRKVLPSTNHLYSGSKFISVQNKVHHPSEIWRFECHNMMSNDQAVAPTACDFTAEPTVQTLCAVAPTASINSMARSVMKRSVQEPIAQKILEIGAGARIDQEIGVDPNPIDYWQSEPAGMIYVSYCSQEDCNKILSAGKRQDKKESSLHGLKVGN